MQRHDENIKKLLSEVGFYHKMPAFSTKKEEFQIFKSQRNTISNLKEIQFEKFHFAPHIYEDRPRGLLQLKAGYRGVSPTIDSS